MLQCVVPETNYEGVGLSMRTFAALRMRPGGYGECGDIRLFFHRFKNTHLLLSASRRTKAVGKDGGCGQWERNASLLGEVHRRH